MNYTPKYTVKVVDVGYAEYIRSPAKVDLAKRLKGKWHESIFGKALLNKSEELFVLAVEDSKKIEIPDPNFFRTIFRDEIIKNEKINFEEIMKTAENKKKHSFSLMEAYKLFWPEKFDFVVNELIFNKKYICQSIHMGSAGFVTGEEAGNAVVSKFLYHLPQNSISENNKQNFIDNFKNILISESFALEKMVIIKKLFNPKTGDIIKDLSTYGIDINELLLQAINNNGFKMVSLMFNDEETKEILLKNWISNNEKIKSITSSLFYKTQSNFDFFNPKGAHKLSLQQTIACDLHKTLKKEWYGQSIRERCKNAIDEVEKLLIFINDFEIKNSIKPSIFETLIFVLNSEPKNNQIKEVDAWVEKVYISTAVSTKSAASIKVL